RPTQRARRGCGGVPAAPDRPAASGPGRGGARGMSQPLTGGKGSATGAAARPVGLLAQLSYGCPLGGPSWSTPTAWPGSGAELSTGEWRRVLGEAADVGVLHVLFSGGEPLLRRDLVDLVVAAREAGLYTNLITSALGLTRARAKRLKVA